MLTNELTPGFLDGAVKRQRLELLGLTVTRATEVPGVTWRAFASW